MGKYRIEKDVPLVSRGRKDSPYPFNEMEINDSFYVAHTRQQTLSSAISSYTKRNIGKKFATRKENDGVRVWRIQ